MDCMYCPKRHSCSGADCYYDYHPEPSPEQVEDLELLAQFEERC